MPSVAFQILNYWIITSLLNPEPPPVSWHNHPGMNLTLVGPSDNQSSQDGFPLMEMVYAVEIPPSLASKHLQLLNSHHPLPEHLDHVKRIWRKTLTPLATAETQLLLLLGPIRGSEDMMDEEAWNEWLHSELSLPDTTACFNCQVPTRMPRTREEYNDWRLRGYWPTTFHEPKTQLKEQADEHALMLKIIEFTMPKLQSVLIVDPLDYENEALWISVADDDDSTGGSATVLDEPVMVAIDKMAKRQLSLGEPRLRLDGKVEYLCTGLVAICRGEPTMMGAMALVHSRIKAVIFVEDDVHRGAVSSCLRLQHVRETNHHFSVYRTSYQ